MKEHCIFHVCQEHLLRTSCPKKQRYFHDFFDSTQRWVCFQATQSKASKRRGNAVPDPPRTCQVFFPFPDAMLRTLLPKCNKFPPLYTDSQAKAFSWFSDLHAYLNMYLIVFVYSLYLQVNDVCIQMCTVSSMDLVGRQSTSSLVQRWGPPKTSAGNRFSAQKRWMSQAESPMRRCRETPIPCVSIADLRRKGLKRD